MTNPAQAAMKPQEFCSRYGVGMTKCYQLIGARLIDARKVGTATIITVESAERWFNSLPKLGPAESEAA